MQPKTRFFDDRSLYTFPCFVFLVVLVKCSCNVIIHSCLILCNTMKNWQNEKFLPRQLWWFEFWVISLSQFIFIDLVEPVQCYFQICFANFFCGNIWTLPTCSAVELEIVGRNFKLETWGLNNSRWIPFSTFYTTEKLGRRTELILTFLVEMLQPKTYIQYNYSRIRNV